MSTSLLVGPPPPVVVIKIAGGEFEEPFGPTRGRARPDQARRKIVDPAFFEFLPAEIFMTSVVFAFRHVFCRVKAKTTEVIKFTFGSFRMPCGFFSAGSRPVEDASRKNRPGDFYGLPGKFFMTSVVSGPKPTFSEVSPTYEIRSNH